MMLVLPLDDEVVRIRGVHSRRPRSVGERARHRLAHSDTACAGVGTGRTRSLDTSRARGPAVAQLVAVLVVAPRALRAPELSALEHGDQPDRTGRRAVQQARRATTMRAGD